MITRLTATEAKTRILSLLDLVESGEEIEITRHGRTIAKLVPARGAHSLKGSLAGVAMSAVGDEELFSTGVGWEVE